MKPTLVIVRDFDGYFEDFVEKLIERKTGPFNHTKIFVTAMPWHPSAVSYRQVDGSLHLTFYSALRSGFGSLSTQDINELIDLL